ncbi:MAG: Lin1244/Lin1753 domain-containing protein [Campylobacteraceae bacterium]
MSKKTPPNFLFPTNFRNTKNIKRLVKDFNVQGYGVAIYLLETLAETPKHRYPLDDIDLLADEMRVSIPVVQTILKNYGIFEIIEDDENVFFSSQLNEWLIPFYKAVEQRKIAGQISASKKKIKQEKQLANLLSLSGSTQQPLNDRSTNKINKLKEIKELNNKNNLSLKEKESENNDFETFRQTLLTQYPNFSFSLPGKLNYSSEHKGFCIKAGYIYSLHTEKLLDKSESFKIWNYLFDIQDKVLEIAKKQGEKCEKN